jgi:uncharacterized tellurite resistance protein B-like protein
LRDIKAQARIIKTENIPVSDSYQAKLLNYLQEKPELAADYLTTTLEEQHLDPELLVQAMAQVYQALLDTDEQKLDHLLDSSEAKVIHKFVDLLQAIGLKVDIAIADPPGLLPINEKSYINWYRTYALSKME